MPVFGWSASIPALRVKCGFQEESTSNPPRIWASFFCLRLPACRTLSVNSEGVVYIDVAGIATLLEVLKAARLLGKQFVLKGLRERPRYLFEVTQLLHLFNGEGDSAAGMGPVSARTS